MSRKKRTIRFKNRFGLHMRPASEVVRIAGLYEAEIHLSINEKRASACSIFELLMLGIRHGDLVDLSAVGLEADSALDELGTFLDSYNDYEGFPDAREAAGSDSFAA